MPTLLQWYGPEYGTSWNQTKIYRSATETGTYSLIATVSPITTTSYHDLTGDSGSWYKISFYDSVNVIEGPLSLPFYAASAATLYCTPTEVRKFMQFASTDFPNDEDATLIMEQAHTQLFDDIAGSTTITSASKLKLLGLLISASFICRSLSSRSLSKGYVAVSMEGINIRKAWDALMNLADRYYQTYLEQLAKDTNEVAMTEFLSDVVGPDTVQDIKDTMNGVTDALDEQSLWKPGINKNERYNE